MKSTGLRCASRAALLHPNFPARRRLVQWLKGKGREPEAPEIIDPVRKILFALPPAPRTPPLALAPGRRPDRLEKKSGPEQLLYGLALTTRLRSGNELIEGLESAQEYLNFVYARNKTDALKDATVGHDIRHPSSATMHRAFL